MNADLLTSEKVACLLGIARLGNWDSKLSQWDSGASKELVNQAFANQALNTLDNYALKCLEVESHGDYRSSVLQEFARSFGVRDYKPLLHRAKANQTRLRTASEFKRREWGSDGFGSSLLRHVLYAIYQSAAQDDPKLGLTYFKTELPDYWA